MVFLCYLRKGVVYISVFAKTEAGFYRAIEPVTSVPVSQTAKLHHAIAETIARGNPIIPTPRYGETSTILSIIPKLAGVKSWNTFERTALSWMITEKDGHFRIIGQREGPYGGWVDDPDETIVFPSSTNVSQVIERLIEIMQEAAATGRQPAKKLDARPRPRPARSPKRRT